jgi:phage terminase large subunit-like protein
MGRGAGKTRSGAEWIRQRVESGVSKRIALVAQTPADVRDVMVEGESGLLKVCPAWNMPVYEPSKRRLTWPNGAFALAFSSYEPDRLRGPQFDTAWCDELASWHYSRETWDNLMFTMRLGEDPKVAVTTTPKPIRLVRDLRSSSRRS